MQRAIRGFHQDALGDWVAELECGHTQHVRHRPPFTLRPWVTSAEGRQERTGEPLECPPCERSEMPAGFAPYRRTSPFHGRRIPEGLLRQHETKPGVWALLEVSSGSLDFVELLGGGERCTRVVAGEHAVIRPAVLHRVEPSDDVVFCIEFWQSTPA